MLLDAEHELEQRAAASSSRFLGVTGESEGQGTAVQGGQPIANRHRCGHALAGRYGMLDTR